MTHEPTRACAGDHCHIHRTDEPSTPTTYRVCFECGHAYQTPDDLMAAYFAAGGGHATRAEEVLFCQMCCHDW